MMTTMLQLWPHHLHEAVSSFLFTVVLVRCCVLHCSVMLACRFVSGFVKVPKTVESRWMLLQLNVDVVCVSET